MNEHCRCEQQPAIDAELQTKGDGCGHSTDRLACWYVVLTDGEIELLREGPKGRHIGANYKYECSEGVDTVRVTGGTYAIQIDVGQFRGRCKPVRVITTPQADLAHVAKILKAEEMVRRLDEGPGHNPDGRNFTEEARGEIIQLATEVADGYQYPDHIRTRIWNLVGEKEPNCFVDPELRAAIAPTAEERDLSLRAEKAVDYVRHNFDAYKSEEAAYHGVILLRKGTKPNWEEVLPKLFRHYRLPQNGWKAGVESLWTYIDLCVRREIRDNYRGRTGYCNFVAKPADWWAIVAGQPGRQECAKVHVEAENWPHSMDAFVR